MTTARVINGLKAVAWAGMTLGAVTLGAGALGGLAACAPLLEVRGFVPEKEKIEALKVGVDNPSTVAEALGSPTLKSTFEEETWYYVSERAERIAFLEPDILQRQILVLSFDPDTSKLKDIGHYGLEDGKVVPLVARTTPAKGRELSFMQEVFGNIGRFGALPNNKQQSPGRRPGGG